MTFGRKDKLKALAIVNIFETGKAFGDFSAVAVLNDGAGVSYGISQFTHKSGSLYKVVNTYLGEGGAVGRKEIEAVLGDLRSGRNITGVSKNAAFKQALKAAGQTPEMRMAQQMIAENFYLQPAVDACEGSGFTQPLSLAVIYDSINHGSYGMIRDNVTINRSNYPQDVQFEKAWITEYTRRRDNWLESVPRLAVTDYRTDFFLAQIARGNWQLALPVSVHGRRLDDADIDRIADQMTAVGEPDYNPLDILGLGDTSSAAVASPASDLPGVLPTDGTMDTQVNPGEPAAQPPTLSQQADTIVNAGDLAQPPPPEDKTIEAPSKDGATATSAKVTIAGITVPPALYAIFQAATDWVEKGYIDAKEILSGLFQLLKENHRYVFWLAGLLIVVLIVKKIVKQITFWIQMVSQMIPHFNNVTVVPAVPETPKRWWQVWK